MPNIVQQYLGLILLVYARFPIDHSTINLRNLCLLKNDYVISGFAPLLGTELQSA